MCRCAYVVGDVGVDDDGVYGGVEGDDEIDVAVRVVVDIDGVVNVDGVVYAVVEVGV